MEVAEKYQKQLPKFKKWVEESYEYLKENFECYHNFMRFTYESTLESGQKMALRQLKRPIIEFSSGAPYIDRLWGEFEKHEPSIMVGTMPGKSADPQLIRFVEDHLRYVLTESNQNGFQAECFKEQLAGGFTVSCIKTDYANPHTFDQHIIWEKGWDPTMYGYDPLARLSHRGDGRYWWTSCPYSLEDAKRTFKKIDEKKLTFLRAGEGFNWSYYNQREKVVMITEMYVKKYRKAKLLKLANDLEMTSEKYQEFLAQWEMMGILAPPPAIAKERMTDIEYICRAVFVENQMLEFEETDYPSFPFVLGIGKGAYIRKESSKQMFFKTIPYLYNLRGTQQLKNLIGQTLANEIENLPNPTIAIAEESYPDNPDLQEHYINLQRNGLLLYKAYDDANPDKQLPPPQQFPRSPIPGELLQTFMSLDQEMQTLLGSYDAELGMNDKDLSGKAIALGSIQSNATAKPYLIGHLQMLTQLAQIHVNLMPKYMMTPRTLPVMGIDGKRSFVTVNDGQGPTLNYDAHTFQVKIEAGPSFAIQKQQALQQIIFLSKASPLFAEFVNSRGLEVILDNIDIRGIDQLKNMAQEFMQEYKQQKMMQMQAAQQMQMNNPALIREKNASEKIQLNREQMQVDAQLDAADLAIRQEQVENDRLKIMSDINIAQAEADGRADAAHAETYRAAVDMAIKTADMSHKHAKEARELDHMVEKAKQDREDKRKAYNVNI